MPMKSSGPGLLFAGSFVFFFLIAYLVSLLAIGLFKLSSYFRFGRLYVSRKLSISSGLSNNCS